ncbi:MAG: monothiol glutaredoxin [Rhodothermales bacterium]|jgi:monothiol glutaredoxin
MTIQERIQKDISDNRVMLYMKGTPDAPMCGFSKHVSAILKHYNAEFAAANVLEDAELRQGIKDFSDWPTVPQLYVDGEFVGGCDITTELMESGELETMLKGK